MKTCSKCNQSKPLSEYYVHSTTKKPYPHCSVCHGNYKKKKSKSVACWFRFGRLNASDDKDLIQDLWSHHRLTVEMFNAILERQGGVCYLCKNGPDSGRSRLCVDHDHNCCPSGKSCDRCRRKLLCNQCNRAIGLFNDDPNLLLQAAQYLLEYSDVLGDSM